jgi:hypothetical protein
MPVYSLRAQPSVQQHIDEDFDMFRCCRLNRNRKPYQKVLESIQIISFCVT